MTYQVQMQYIPQNSQIWVSRINPEDPIYTYDNQADAQNKADELQANDTTGRKYKVAQDF